MPVGVHPLEHRSALGSYGPAQFRAQLVEGVTRRVGAEAAVRGQYLPAL